MLELSHLKAGYGKGEILSDLSLSVGEGEIVSLLGRNGAGKTTTLRSIMGLSDVRDGGVHFLGRDIRQLSTFERARLGLCLVPEDRMIFSALTVEENLLVSRSRKSKWTLADAYRYFRRLHERRHSRGGTLSGGEQQMLAIARALLNGPRLLMLDEPSEGLAPTIVEEIVEIMRTIREMGVSILLVEQNLEVCCAVSERLYVIDDGRIVSESGPRKSAELDEVVKKYLAV
ncbi:ABC transporter ATP-binding protein [Bradyrhizobium sp.]|uniref:ABC transporter ATP-binding protein n=1 Tax=Bradyrhizobium sp. TaxID=376 RepID=UPI0039E2A9B8